MTLTYNDFKGDLPTLEQIIERAEKNFYPSHDEVVEELGIELLTYEYVGLYQGDVFMFLRHEDRYGFLAFAFGSCEACDWLQSELIWKYGDADDDFYSITYLPESFYLELSQMIGWGTREEVLKYIFEERDWEVYWESPEPFLQAVREWVDAN